MWIAISGCHKFTAQTALGYADRLSPQLPVPFQVVISYTSTGENVSWILFPSFGGHLLPPFQGGSRTSCFPSATSSPGRDVWKRGLLLPIHVSESLYSSFYTAVLLYAIFTIQLSSFSLISFWTGSSYLPCPLFLSLLLTTHTAVELLMYYTVSWVLQLSWVEAMKQEEKIPCFLLDYRLVPLCRSKPCIFCNT